MAKSGDGIILIAVAAIAYFLLGGGVGVGGGGAYGGGAGGGGGGFGGGNGSLDGGDSGAALDFTIAPASGGEYYGGAFPEYGGADWDARVRHL